ncbi:DeoR/GlpR family DNA-binding transcription regulator [Zongyangia hominis]|uniref:DeoR/GlpR transcriptional regulator n=1 Tax=Zongyangia hominis TaxID=2763677 RepID=A0A926EBC7_9FIRM|nr:DeoR/GlpR family DNA-binding transcription regulator [Zongyangia hominis]MBC8571400.1 DeoR/GlpR transcriptional regulator [Zongyangia hominis]
MKNASERRDQIIKLLQKHGTVSNQELAELFGATPATIRRDLDYLEGIGALTRSWGKATIGSAITTVAPPAEREGRSLGEKEAIARAAARFVEDGDSLILDSSTTVLQMAESLQERSALSVVTNFISAAYAFAGSGISLQFSGGFFDDKMMSLVGPDCEAFFRSISVSKAFIGTTSLRAGQGFAVCSPFQSEAKRSMIAAAEQVFILMDQSKVGAYGINTFADFADVDVLITTGILEKSLEDQLRKSGVEIIYADR